MEWVIVDRGFRGERQAEVMVDAQQTLCAILTRALAQQVWGVAQMPSSKVEVSQSRFA